MLFTDYSNEWETKLKAGPYMQSVTVTKEGNRLFFKFNYNKALAAEIKVFEGAKWHGYDPNPRKVWSVADSARNRFQLLYLENPKKGHPRNPYTRYDTPYVDFKTNRKVYNHQTEMVGHGLTRRQCILAAEMGTGKTLTAIEIIELSGMHDWIWVGPKGANYSVQLEFDKWKGIIRPTFVTYDGLKKLLAEWPEGKKAPQGLIVDECSRCKNPTAQRTQAVKYLADNIRAEWGDQGFVILMSGSPAPKSPADWWSLCEIACPGFLREGSIEKFKNRLAIIETREGFNGGGAYPHLVTWKDDPAKCNVCGLYKEAETHANEVNVFGSTTTFHQYEPSTNEVDLLYKRMQGLVLVKFKKDCLDLPEKVYREITCKPSLSIQNASKAIQAKASSAAQALVLLRELSDGFQYVTNITGEQVCRLCKGGRTILAPDPDNTENMIDTDCPNCGGTGNEDKTERTAKQIPCPKEDILKNLLDEHEEVGRIVIYGGFTGSIDRIASIVKSAQWNFIRVDGRGWYSDIPGTPTELLQKFQEGKEKFPRVAFMGQPGAAGMGITLTASPTIVYYSNDFNAESRIQSEDRIHRAGMDTNRGATIIDILHLPSDKVVLDSLKKKRRLQDISMGQMNSMIQNAELDIGRKL